MSMTTTIKMRCSTLLGVLLCCIAAAWSLPPQQPTARRTVLERAIATAAGVAWVGSAPRSLAVPPPHPPSPQELERLAVGHARVQYLLHNWDSLTSVCGKGVMSDAERRQVVRTEGGGGGSCEKTPLVVQEYMGYKSTEDPLYRADKLMVRAAPLVDNAVLEDYLDVVERYREKADNVAMMAYTSSWGEANPNGGKEIVDDYLERTKVDVQESEKLLKAVLDFLNLNILPPSKGKF